MRSRFPLLWLKKRGGRRSGSPRWGLSGELLYHGVFVLVGAAACWWQIANVLAPEWRLRERLQQSEKHPCRVVASRVDERAGRWTPVCSVSILGTQEAAETREPVDALAGNAAATRHDAELALDHFPVGKTFECWLVPEAAYPARLDRGASTHAWLLLLVPLSLAMIGLVGMVRTVLKAGASAERRQAVAQHAGRFDPLTGGGVSVALASGLPSTRYVDDSPGVKLRYRLPIEGATGWRIAGMAVMCVGWNLLVGFFLIGVVTDHLAGRPNWAVTLVVTPLACAGGWLAYALLRDAWSANAVGVTQVEISTHPLLPGQTVGGLVLQAGQFRARWLTVSLVCEEIATYCEGTDTRVSIQEVHTELLHRERRLRVEADRPYEQAFTFTPPAGAMHSFQSPHNELRWSIEVRGAPVRWPEFRRRFQLCVYPAQPRSEPEQPTEQWKTATPSTAESPA